MQILSGSVLLLATFLTAQQQKKEETKGENPPELSNSNKPPFLSNLEKMPELLPKCVEGCLKPFLLTLRASFVSGNNYERLVNTCDKLRSVYECMDRIKKCQPNHLFRIITDGLRYMCVEHPDAFRDMMECMDIHAHVATEDCKQQCSADKLIVGWFVYMAMRSTTFLRMGEGGLPPRVNVIFFRKITTEACTILQCYFLCLKTKYNARCHGLGGNLLLEVIIRPLAAVHDSLLLSPFMNIVKLMMPVQCNFIMTDAGVAWHRIDPKLEEDLKEFYKNRTEPLVKFRRLPGNMTKLRKPADKSRTKRSVDYEEDYDYSIYADEDL